MSKFDALRKLNDHLLTLLLVDEMTVTERRRQWIPTIKQLMEGLSAVAVRVADGASDEETLKEIDILIERADQVIQEMEEEGIPCRSTSATAKSISLR